MEPSAYKNAARETISKDEVDWIEDKLSSCNSKALNAILIGVTTSQFKNISKAQSAKET